MEDGPPIEKQERENIFYGTFDSKHSEKRTHVNYSGDIKSGSQENGMARATGANQKKIYLADKLLCIVFVLILGWVSADYVVIGTYLFLIPYLILTRRKILFYNFMVSTAMACVWVFIAKNEYRYNHNFLVVANLNLFPLFAWAVGLSAVFVIFSHYGKLWSGKRLVWQTLMYGAFYWPLLFGIETIGFHKFNIQRIDAAAYQGLPVLDCIHTPRWMQAAYLSMGPLFFLVCSALKLTQPPKPHHSP
jgi:hypothetical protein